MQVSALNIVMESITPAMRRRHNALHFGEHVVLMGHTNHKTIKMFADEFFATGACFVRFLVALAHC